MQSSAPHAFYVVQIPLLNIFLNVCNTKIFKLQDNVECSRQISTQMELKRDAFISLAVIGNVAALKRIMLCVHR